MSTAKKEEAVNGAPVRISSLAQLEAICTRTVLVVARIYDQDVEIPVRLLLDGERVRIQEILLEAQPPVKKKEPLPEAAEGAAPAEPAPVEYEVSEDYKKKLRHHLRLARACTLYLCCPIFAEARPGLKDREAILEAITETKLTDQVLEKLYQVALSEDQKLPELVDFT